MKMKNLIAVLLTIYSFTAYTQDYKYHAIQSQGFTVKALGTINIEEELLTINSEDKTGSTTNTYDIINTRNGITYISDGVSTHHYIIEEKQGKKKGKKFSGILYLTMTIQNQSNLILYFLTAEDQ